MASISPIINGGMNNALASVIQIFLEIDEFRNYYLGQSHVGNYS